MQTFTYDKVLEPYKLPFSNVDPLKGSSDRVVACAAFLHAVNARIAIQTKNALAPVKLCL